MACQRPSFSSAFDPGRASTFRVETVFRSPGVHEVVVSVFSGGCRSVPGVTRRILTVTVLPGAGPASVSGGPAARAAANGAQRRRVACADADLEPTAATLRRVERAAICLMNAERRKARGRPLRGSSRLRRTASGHSADMIRRRFFAHENPAGPSLKQRLQRGRYRGRPAGENIGFDSLGSARRMVEAWMASPPHRANLLSRQFRFVGVGLVLGKPVQGLTPGATYTVNFGRNVR
jgi:uncharacterized protein YkwD